jgi:hypothetical protein
MFLTELTLLTTDSPETGFGNRAVTMQAPHPAFKKTKKLACFTYKNIFVNEFQ